MILFFGIVASLGLVMVLLDFAAFSTDITPSLYRFTITGSGLALIFIGAVGAASVWVTS